MFKKIIALLSIFIAIQADAQTKQLTLEESVLQQYRAFRPDQLAGFHWLPNSNHYAYFTDNWSKMVTATPIQREPKVLISLPEMNKALNTKIPHLFGTTWVDTQNVLVTDGTKYYYYNPVMKTGKEINQVPENAENITIDSGSKNIAYTIDNNLYLVTNNKQTHTVTQETNKAIVSGQSISRSEFGIHNGIFWSPNSSYLAFYQKNESEVADYPLLDITTTPGKLIDIKYPMAGQKSEKPRVGIYNLATKNTVFISPKGDSNDYVTNLAWTPDEKYVLIAEVNRGQNDMNLNMYDATTGKFVRTLFNEKNSKWVEPEHAAFFPNKNNSNFVWISERDGFNNLYYYSIEGKLIKQLTTNKFPTREIIGSNTVGTEIYFKATGENATNMLAYKVTLKGKQTLLTKESGVHEVLVNFDGSCIFDEFTNHNTPSKSILLDKNLKATTLLESDNKLKEYALGTSEIKTIKAADGSTDLYTRLIKPSNFDPNKKYPVLVYVYGGPHAQLITNSYLDGANLWMFWMAEQGYLIYTVDNRGSDNRGFAFESIIHRNLGKNEIEDQIKGVDYLKSLPYVDADRLAVHGWSYGGFMTTSLMLRKPDTFKVGVAGGPVTDWKYYEIMYGERYMDTPEENPEGYKEASTLNYVNNLKGKLLLIHGTSDDVVVMQHSFDLIKKFIDNQKQVDFFPYPMHKHNVSGKDRVHLMEKVLHYVIDNNK
jgi:dipeptidyl-peptidase-4